MRLIALVYPTRTVNDALKSEILDRTFALADVVVVGENQDDSDNWKQMEGWATPETGDFIFVMHDLDYVDDLNALPRWLLLNSDVAYACKRLSMMRGNEYRIDGAHKPTLSYNVFPYRRKAALHDSGLPTYSYELPHINDPHLTILNFENYDNNTTNTSATTRRWENPVPQTAG